MNLHQKALRVAITCMWFSKYACRVKRRMFPVKTLVAFKIKMGSTTDHLHPPTPTTVQVLPPSNCSVHSVGICNLLLLYNTEL